MELVESIGYINRKLIDEFGIDSIKNIPIFRVVWSEDQFEKRLGTYTDSTPSGIFIREVTEIREVPKYRQWIQQKYVLERLCLIPEYQKTVLPVGETDDGQVTYEPLFVFEDVNGKYLPPQWIVAKIAVDSVYAAQGKKSLAGWKDEFKNQDDELNDRTKRVDELQTAIFGDETAISDAFARKTAVTDFNVKNGPTYLEDFSPKSIIEEK